MVDNDMVGICREGEMMPDVKIGCSRNFYECVTDRSTSLQYWQINSCQKNQVFSRFSKRCNETCKLTKVKNIR